MTVLIEEPRNAERLGRAAVRAALDDLTVLEYSLEPGSEPGNPHYHAQHADSFYVLEGELEFQIDGCAVRASAGSLVVAPRGAVHAFPIAIGSRARFLNLHTPGGFERYMRELTAMRSRAGIGDAVRIKDHFQIKTPTFKLNSRFDGTFRNAEASGSVSVGSTNLTPDPAAFAQMGSVKQGEVAIVH